MYKVPDLPCLESVEYRTYRTDNYGLTVRDSSDDRFIPWEEISDAETMGSDNIEEHRFILRTRQGKAVEIPYDNSHFSASLWQHLRPLGLHWFIDLYIEVENFWWPIPEHIPHKLVWKCRHRSLCQANHYATRFLMRPDGFEAKTVDGVVSSDWDSITKTSWEDTVVQMFTASGTNVAVPWDSDDKRSMELLLAIIRRLREVKRPVCLPLPENHAFHVQLWEMCDNGSWISWKRGDAAIKKHNGGDSAAIAELKSIWKRQDVDQVTSRLLRLLTHVHPFIREDAAAALQLEEEGDFSGDVPFVTIMENCFSRPGVEDTVLTMLRHPDPNVRSDAARYMGIGFSFHIREDPICPLIPLLSDVDRNVRIAAIWALGEMQERAAITYLRPFVDDKDEEISKHAKQAIRWIEIWGRE